MADGVLTLSREERRLRWTFVAVAGGMVLSTIAVSDTRALFNPLAQASAEPSAYAFLLPKGYGGTGALDAPGSGHRHSAPVHRKSATPVAYAARVPAEATPTSRVAPAASAATPLDAENEELALNSPSDLVLPTSGSGSSGFTGGNLGPPTIGGPGIDTPGVGPGIGGGSDPSPDPTSPLPEPSTWATMILGLGLVAFMLRRMQKSTSAA